MNTHYSHYEYLVFYKKSTAEIPIYMDFVRKNLDWYGHSALERALKENIEVIALELIKSGVQICTLCLHYAIKNNNKMLLDITTGFASRETISASFGYAMKKKRSEWITSVMNKVIPEKIVEDVITHNDYHILDLLIKKKINLNATNALPYAASKNDTQMVCYLSKHGAANYNKALMAVCNRDGSPEMAKLLILLGATNREECKKWTDNKEILEVLNN